MTLSNIFSTFVKHKLLDNTKMPMLHHVVFSVFYISSRTKQTCDHTYLSSVASLHCILLLFAQKDRRKYQSYGHDSNHGDADTKVFKTIYH